MQLKPANFYVLRLPALPLFSADTGPTDASDQLRRLWEDTRLPEAVFVASPALYTQISSHLDLKGWPLPPAQARSLWKYALRMRSRATPFGLMAAFSMGYVRDSSRFTFGNPSSWIRHHRLDMDCMAGLVRALAEEPAIRTQLRFWPNNSRYIVDNELRYTERDDSRQKRHYFLSAVSVTDHLLATLQQAASGATIYQLRTALVEKGIPFDEADLFVDQLIENQLLISELEPRLTSPPMLADLRRRLASMTETRSVVQALMTVEEALSLVDVDSRRTHRIVRQSLESGRIHLPEQHLIQTDLELKPVDNQINGQVMQTILNQISRLGALNRPQPNPQLAEFSRRFQERYDQQEVALQDVLDGDFGIGYGNTSGGQAVYTALLDELAIPKSESPVQLAWGPYENLLVTKLSQALRTGQQQVELTENELLSLNRPDTPAIPASFYVFGNLLSPSVEALDRGDFTFAILAVEGPSAANMLGRFCAHSPALTEAVRAALQREEQHRPDAIYAEIVHWPDDRLGNILIRPVLREYEIPYISQASVADDHQLPLSDLLVSIRPGGRVILRSKRHNKEVIPRLSTAHNYRLGLSTYQFLADLQHQDAHMHWGWDWSVLNEQPFLPRITYRNLIISRARWTLHRSALPVSSAADLLDHLQTTYALPRWVAVADGDNELLLDLSTLVGQQLLLDEVQRQAVIRLVEWVATPDQCWLHDGSEVYVNELVIPVETIMPTNAIQPAAAPAFAKEVSRQSKLRADRQPLPAIRRSFGPGSEWLYVKLYAGAQLADDLLKTVVGPFVQELNTHHPGQTSFFVRYADPEPHLRLRFYADTPHFYGLVLDKLNDWLEPHRESGSVYRVQVDTYERELERYGYPTMAPSEKLFDCDSWAVLCYLAQETDPADRWQFALQSCDSLLNDFGLPIQQKARLLQHLQAQFLTEHRANRELRQQLNDRFRAERSLINELLAPAHQADDQSISLILAERSRALKPVAEQIKTGINTLGPTLESLLASYLHMSLNRVFPAQQRTHELVIYHFLTRYYESAQVRQLP